MTNAIEQVIALVYAVGILIVLPLAIVAGWIRWAKNRPLLASFSLLSLVAFGLVTCSGLLAVYSLIYAHAIGGFPYYDPRLLRFYRWGGMLSLGGSFSALSVVGVVDR